MASQIRFSILWAASGAVGQALVKLIALLFLSRLLSPSDFGAFAIVGAIFASSDIFLSGGVGSSLVNCSRVGFCDIAFYNRAALILACIFGSLLLLYSAEIAEYFDVEGLGYLLSASPIYFVLKAVGTAPEAILTRRRMFKHVAIATSLSYALGYLPVALILAYYGQGARALLTATIVQVGVFSAIGLWFARRWNCIRSYRRVYPNRSIGSVWSFIVGRTGGYAANNVDYFLIGKLLGSEALAFYSRAFFIFMQPVSLLGSSVERVFFSEFSKFQNNAGAVRATFSRAWSGSFVLGLWFGVLALPLVHRAVGVILGGGWDPVGDVLLYLVIALPFRISYKISGALIRAAGPRFAAGITDWINVSFVLAAVFFGATAFGTIQAVAKLICSSIAAYSLILLAISLRYCHARIVDFKPYLKTLIVPLGVLFPLVYIEAKMPAGGIGSDLLCCLGVLIAWLLAFVLVRSFFPSYIHPSMQLKGIKGTS